MFVEALSFKFVNTVQLVGVLGRGEGHSEMVFTSQTAVSAVSQCVSGGVCLCVHNKVCVHVYIQYII